MNEESSYLDFLRTFAEAMPAQYRARHDAFAIADHARLVYERADRALNVGAFRGSEDVGTPMCIVSRDQPTLVSALSRALVLTRFDVVAAEAYTPQPSLRLKGIVGLFWVGRRSKPGPLSVAEARMLREVILGLANRADGVRSTNRMEVGGRPNCLRDDAQVRFVEGQDGNLATVEVEAADRAGVLQALVKALLAQQVQIVHCEVQVAGGRVRDRFRLVDHHGGSIAPSRWREIQVHVLDAMSQTVMPPSGNLMMA